MASLDDRIDELYALPLAEFTGARNVLAKTLTGAEAKRIKQLPKPTVVPWAVNQVYWNARPVYDRLLERGTALRKAQIAALQGKSSDVRGAAEAHRAAVAAAAAEATRLAAAADANPGAEPLTRMFESLSIAPKHPGEPGRLTDMVQPAGFEALLGITPAARTLSPRAEPVGAEPPAPRATPATAARESRKDRERARAERERQEEERKKEAALSKQRAAERRHAEQELARAETAEAEARADLERAQQRLEDASRAAAAARKALRDLPA